MNLMKQRLAKKKKKIISTVRQDDALYRSVSFLFGFVWNVKGIPVFKFEDQHVFDNVQLHLCEEDMEKFIERVTACQQSCDGHLMNILLRI